MENIPLDTVNYSKEELTVSAARANALAIVFIVPVLFLFVPAYIWLWPEQFELHTLQSFFRENRENVFLYPLLLFIPGAIVHELLHGLTWALFCKNGLKSIKYGVHWQLLTPYCHCKEVLPLRPYVLGGMMPGLVMGVLPTIAGLATGNIYLFAFGLLFTFAAGGDALILWMLRKTKKEDLVQDHPDLIGCIVYHKL
ncbi:DUF3267 domain-containing protein [Pontibacter sp. Tf4]|uniref:DUF3267 domain-containing protein n=1 Tax=Pontibacter sp. Tf4 TaxID=2761620 RepID=UPI001629BDF6|nr:DUF3267 domain-containing protein [Pontibacter sp. Tf4]MBB6611149.1 DUF3267 domain-containing protein [Pontibacter sp. Tf4]